MMTLRELYDTARLIRLKSKTEMEGVWAVIGDNVRERREFYGMSQAELARLVERSRVAICNLEKGRGHVSRSLLEKIDILLNSVNNQQQQK